LKYVRIFFTKIRVDQEIWHVRFQDNRNVLLKVRIKIVRVNFFTHQSNFSWAVKSELIMKTFFNCTYNSKDYDTEITGSSVRVKGSIKKTKMKYATH